VIRWLLSFPYFLREALKGMRESAGVPFIAVGITTISLIFLGALWIVRLNVSDLIVTWRERFQLTIFLAEGASPEQREALRRVVSGAQAVQRVEEVSPERAVEEFRGWLGPDADLLEGFDGNFLPASIRVILKPDRRDLAHVESLMAQVRLMPGVERTRNDLAWLRRLEGAIRLVDVAAWTLSGLLGLGVVFIIGNTIRLTLFARKDDIEIMHLVGATDIFLKTPYVAEGVLCGALGGALSVLALWGLFYGVFLPLAGRYAGEEFAMSAGGWSLALGLLGTGAALGFLGSAFSVRHFLRGTR